MRCLPFLLKVIPRYRAIIQTSKHMRKSLLIRSWYCFNLRQGLGTDVSMFKIHTYLKKCTVPQVQGYRPGSFGTRTNPVGGKMLVGKSALRYTTPQTTLSKESWPRLSLALTSTHLSKNSSDSSGKLSGKCTPEIILHP